jgi:molybdopterin converting factor small subunit
MRVTVSFYSYLKDMTGCAQAAETVPEGCTLEELYRKLARHFPKLADFERSTLMAVDVDYQPRSYVLREGDEVALFPPVQGG